MRIDIDPMECLPSEWLSLLGDAKAVLEDLNDCVSAGSGPSTGQREWARRVRDDARRSTLRVRPATPAGLLAARLDLKSLLAHMKPPSVTEALATGGTARSLEKIVGGRLGSAEFAGAQEIMTHRKARDIEQRYGIPRWRARLLPAGFTILAEIQRTLEVDLTVAQNGLREGAALELAEYLWAAA